MRSCLSIWTVYEHPHNWPEHYVARRFEVDGNHREPLSTDDIITSSDLELVRRALSLRGLTCLARRDEDEPHIVETWL